MPLLTNQVRTKLEEIEEILSSYGILFSDEKEPMSETILQWHNKKVIEALDYGYAYGCNADTWRMKEFKQQLQRKLDANS